MQGVYKNQHTINQITNEWTMKPMESVWRNSPLFIGISNHHLNRLEQHLVIDRYKANEYIIKEGELGSQIYFIEEGLVRIEKGGVQFAEKKAGEHFGAMALMDRSPRSADVIATTDIVVKKLTLTRERVNILKEEGVYSIILTNHIRSQQSLLRNMNNVAIKEVKAKLEESQRRVLAAHFFVLLTFGLVCYQFFLGVFISFNDVLNNTVTIQTINLFLIPALGGIAAFCVHKSDLPLAHYGLHLDNWRSHIRESLVWTFYFILALIGVKWLMTLYLPYFKGAPIFVNTYFQAFDNKTIILVILSYIIIAPIQEFIVRGTLQTNLMDITSGKWNTAQAIIISNLIFSAFHVHFDIKFAVLTIIPGLFWGVLYARQQSLVGVSVSHFIIGLFVMGFMGLL